MFAHRPHHLCALHLNPTIGSRARQAISRVAWRHRLPAGSLGPSPGCPRERAQRGAAWPPEIHVQIRHFGGRATRHAPGRSVGQASMAMVPQVQEETARPRSSRPGMWVGRQLWAPVRDRFASLKAPTVPARATDRRSSKRWRRYK